MSAWRGKRVHAAIRDEAKSRLEGIGNPIERARKAAFLEAVIATCDALAIWALR
jgi:hypothetical protein